MEDELAAVQAVHQELVVLPLEVALPAPLPVGWPPGGSFEDSSPRHLPGAKLDLVAASLEGALPTESREKLSREMPPLTGRRQPVLQEKLLVGLSTQRRTLRLRQALPALAVM